MESAKLVASIRFGHSKLLYSRYIYNSISQGGGNPSILNRGGWLAGQPVLVLHQRRSRRRQRRGGGASTGLLQRRRPRVGTRLAGAHVGSAGSVWVY